MTNLEYQATMLALKAIKSTTATPIWSKSHRVKLAEKPLRENDYRGHDRLWDRQSCFP